MSKIELGAYFYPITTQCPVRRERARKLGISLVDETLLVQNAPRRFEGHNQPKIYCLGEKKWTRWDDTDMGAMEQQIDLAQQHGISFWVFNTYMGTRNGGVERELARPLDEVFLRAPQKMKFGLMCVLGGASRVVLPIQPGSSEPDRHFEISSSTTRALVDECARKYWSLGNYLEIRGRPYLSIYTASREPVDKIRIALSELRDYTIHNYNVNPYIVGVITDQYQANDYMTAGVDGLTGYAWLPDFGSGAQLIQGYANQVEKRIEDWHDALHTGLPVIPPAVVGWDASPRCKPHHSLKRVRTIRDSYPLVPIVIGGTSVEFEGMLRRSLNFIREHVVNDQQYGIVCSWNEVAEGNALLPQLVDGEPDFSYLKSVKNGLNDFN